ncbi:protein translocase subunit SecD [Patescibacteria group bacterium]|nr:MAG: protein translocase subunit SecD [Patescibacteria group bacterium]
MWKVRIFAVILLLVGVGIGWFVFDSEKPTSKFPFHFGLDLAGGSHLLYRADTSKVSSGDIPSAMASLRDVVERRVNAFGVSEPLVQIERGGVVGGGEDRLIVELPGVTDLSQAVSAIGKTPTLEFLLQSTDSTGALVYTETGLTGQYLDHATLEFSSGRGGTLSNQPIIAIKFNTEGATRFKNITEKNTGKVLGIFLDGTPISTPVIQEVIPNGEATITGTFTPDEARELVRNLNFGALPVPIELVSSQTVGASLGEKALTQSVDAGIWGFVLVALFLIVWYRLPGLISVFALTFYVALNLAIFKLIPVTLTTAGLAAFILSIGMAVDANILIFERTKEELAKGKVLGEAIREGFKRAWSSIRDSNLSSIITGVILFWLGGTAVIKGFALIFVIGVIVSMFTAITLTRTLLLALGFGSLTSKASHFLFGNELNK